MLRKAAIAFAIAPLRYFQLELPYGFVLETPEQLRLPVLPLLNQKDKPMAGQWRVSLSY